NLSCEFWNKQMPRSSTQVSLIERPINQPVEKHRRRPRKYHANDDEEKSPQRRPAIGGDDERAQSKRQRKNRVRKANQPQKTTQWSSFKLRHDNRLSLLKCALSSAQCLTW